MTRFAFLFSILFICLILILFQCGDDDDDDSGGGGESDDDTGDDDTSDDDDDTATPQQECNNESAGILFHESWNDCTAGDVPGGAWQVETLGGGTAEIVPSDEWLTDDIPVEKALNLGTADGATSDQVTVSRTHTPGSEYAIDSSYWIKFISGGIFRLGMTTVDQSRRTDVILDNTGATPMVQARDVEGNLHTCSEFSAGTWIRLTMIVSMETFSVWADGESGDCDELRWQNPDEATEISGFIMTTGTEDPATVLVDQLQHTHLESP